jgi:hypothetical protein
MFPPEMVNQIGAVATGYFAGMEAQKQQYAELLKWEPTIRAINIRWGQLWYQVITKPLPTFNAVPVTTITLRESIMAYMYGLPSSSVFSTGRTLELALAISYEADLPPSVGPGIT